VAYKPSQFKSVRPMGPSCKKAMYHSREEAEDMIRYIRESRVTRDLQTYQCPVCGLWHLTSKTK
jgi:hypothetical protein